MFERIKNLFRAKLTDATVTGLVGHSNIVYYNFDTNTWNTDEYNGYKIQYQFFDPDVAPNFKRAMGTHPMFRREYEMAATVTMTIDSKQVTNWSAPTVADPWYSETGTVVVGNIIVWNKKTKKFELYCKNWGVAAGYRFPLAAACNGANDFAYRGATNPEFRTMLHAAHMR